MTRTRPWLVVVAVTLAVVLAGCSLAPTDGGTGTESESAPPVPDGEDAAAAYESLGNVSGDIQVRVTHGNRTNESTLSFAGEVGTRNLRQRVISPDRHAGNLFVSNETHYWQYNDTRDVAKRFAHDETTFKSTFGTGEDGFGAFLEAAFDAARTEDGTVSDLPDVGVGPAPTVASADGDDRAATTATANVSEFVVSYDGTAMVGGQRTHVLVATPADTAENRTAENLTVTYYVDAERYFPVRVERDAVVGGKPWSHEMTFSNLSYDANASASTYRFDPGERTRVLDYATGVVGFQTRTALAANTTVPLPEPDVPAGFEFAYGAGIELNTTGAQTIYSNGSTVLIAGRYVDDGIVTPRERARGENVTVDGHRAFYVDLGRTTALYVYCDDYVVSGAGAPNVPRDLLVAFTTSLDCDDESASGASDSEAYEELDGERDRAARANPTGTDGARQTVSRNGA